MEEEKSKTETIYIESISEPQKETLAIRANLTHSLLAIRCEKGLLLYDRRTRQQHLLTWEEIQQLQSK